MNPSLFLINPIFLFLQSFSRENYRYIVFIFCSLLSEFDISDKTTRAISSCLTVTVEKVNEIPHPSSTTIILSECSDLATHISDAKVLQQPY